MGGGLNLEVRVCGPNKVGHVDNTAQQIRELVEVADDLDQLGSCLCIYDAVDQTLGFVEGAGGVFLEALGVGKVIIVKQAGARGVGVVDFGLELFPCLGVVAAGKDELDCRKRWELGEGTYKISRKVLSSVAVPGEVKNAGRMEEMSGLDMAAGMTEP